MKNAAGGRTPRNEDPELRRAWVTLLATSLARGLPVGERTIAALEIRSKAIATLLGDPSCAFRRQDAEHSALIGGIYRRSRFGSTTKANSDARSVEIAQKFERERRQRKAAEAKLQKFEATASTRRLSDAVAIIKQAERQWGLSANGKATTQQTS